jgi:hypothetical protein
MPLPIKPKDVTKHAAGNLGFPALDRARSDHGMCTPDFSKDVNVLTCAIDLRWTLTPLKLEEQTQEQIHVPERGYGGLFRLEFPDFVSLTARP